MGSVPANPLSKRSQCVSRRVGITFSFKCPFVNVSRYLTTPPGNADRGWQLYQRGNARNWSSPTDEARNPLSSSDISLDVLSLFPRVFSPEPMHATSVGGSMSCSRRRHPAPGGGSLDADALAKMRRISPCFFVFVFFFYSREGLITSDKLYYFTN